MSTIRLFVPDPLAAGGAISLAAGQAHYLGAVMRRRVGDCVLVFNGRDGEWQARITSVGRGVATVAVETRIRGQTEAADLWLLAPVLKRDPLGWLIEKATELGAAQILLTTSARSAVAEANTARLAAIATEAAEQCGRLDVPRIEPPAPLSARLAAWPGERLLLAGDETGASPPIASVLAGAPPSRWGVLVGPEGGFAPAELDALGRLPFCRRAGLGARIMRAETAAVAAIAILQALAGDWCRDHVTGRPG